VGNPRAASFSPSSFFSPKSCVVFVPFPPTPSSWPWGGGGGRIKNGGGPPVLPFPLFSSSSVYGRLKDEAGLDQTAPLFFFPSSSNTPPFCPPETKVKEEPAIQAAPFFFSVPFVTRNPGKGGDGGHSGIPVSATGIPSLSLSFSPSKPFPVAVPGFSAGGEDERDLFPPPPPLPIFSSSSTGVEEERAKFRATGLPPPLFFFLLRPSFFPFLPLPACRPSSRAIHMQGGKHLKKPVSLPPLPPEPRSPARGPR